MPRNNKRSRRFKIQKMDPSEVGEDNGLILNGVLLPEEIIIQILSHVDMKYILKCQLVCKKWNEIITSTHMWRVKCDRIGKVVKKKLPWYAYYVLFCDDMFDKNLILNNCGQNQFKYWIIKSNGGDKFLVENPPVGSDPLPETPEIGANTSCFATSWQNCSKFQDVSFKNKKLHQKVFDELQPHIYVSEWFAARFDCGCEYKLSLWLLGKKNELLIEQDIQKRVEQWAGREWQKVELTLEKYPKGVQEINFYHKGNDTSYWAGHYGSKMSGAVLKVLWDSIAC